MVQVVSPLEWNSAIVAVRVGFPEEGDEGRLWDGPETKLVEFEGSSLLNRRSCFLRISLLVGSGYLGMIPSPFPYGLKTPFFVKVVPVFGPNVGALLTNTSSCNSRSGIGVPFGTVRLLKFRYVAFPQNYLPL